MNDNGNHILIHLFKLLHNCSDCSIRRLGDWLDWATGDDSSETTDPQGVDDTGAPGNVSWSEPAVRRTYQKPVPAGTFRS